MEDNMKQRLALTTVAGIVLLLGVAISASNLRGMSTMMAGCCGTDHCLIRKKVDQTKTMKGDDCSCCKNDTCSMRKKDDSKKPDAASNEKCECCGLHSMKGKEEKGDHDSMSAKESMAHGKSCDCACCKKKGTDKKKSSAEVVTIASMTY